MPKATDDVPAIISGNLVVNLDWNDLVNCSSCNVSISVRILSPGDDGGLTQTNAVSTTTSLASAVDSLQQWVAAAPAAPVQAPPVVPVAVAPTVPISLPVVSAGAFQPAPGPELEAAPASAPPASAPEPSAGSDDGALAASTAPPDAAPALPAEVTTAPVAADTTAIPLTKVATAPARRHHRVTAPVRTPRAGVFMPAVAAPPASLPAVGRHVTVVPELEAVAAPTDAGRRIPSRAPPPTRLPPPDGPWIGSAPAGLGAGPPADSPASLLALLVFLVPGFAQWLWARAELRPAALRPGRPERPG